MAAHTRPRNLCAQPVVARSGWRGPGVYRSDTGGALVWLRARANAIDADLEHLTASGHTVLRTQSPSRSDYGSYVRQALTTLDQHPYALAGVLAADRYHQVHTEIMRALQAGKIVVSDRYAASGALDIARGVPADVVWSLHAALPRPGLAVIFTVDPDVAASRIQARGRYSRWQVEPGGAQREAEAYRAAAQHLTTIGWPVVLMDSRGEPGDVVALIANHLARQRPLRENR